MPTLELKLLEGSFSIHRLHPSAGIPEEVLKSGFFAVCRSDEELSVVCPASLALEGSRCDKGWSGFKITGPLDLSEVGIVAGVSRILSVYRISVFVVSTHDTDYFFVKSSSLNRAVSALKNAGYIFL